MGCRFFIGGEPQRRCNELWRPPRFGASSTHFVSMAVWRTSGSRDFTRWRTYLPPYFLICADTPFLIRAMARVAARRARIDAACGIKMGIGCDMQLKKSALRQGWLWP
jgi:hypothetical protein